MSYYNKDKAVEIVAYNGVANFNMSFVRYLQNDDERGEKITVEGIDGPNGCVRITTEMGRLISDTGSVHIGDYYPDPKDPIYYSRSTITLGWDDVEFIIAAFTALKAGYPHQPIRFNENDKEV